MFILSRYILRAHIGPFLFGASTVMFVFLMQFLMNYLNQFLGKGLGTWVIVQLIALNLAWMVTLAVPMGVLVSTLMAFGNLSASNEVTIVKSGGASLLRMMFPVVLVGAVLSLWLFWFNDSVLPDANYRAQMLMMDMQRKKPTFVMEKGQFSSQLEGYSILARKIDSARGVMLGITIYDNTKFDRLNVVSADSGVINFSSDFSKMVLLLTNGEIHQVNQQNLGDYRRITFATHRIIMDAHGFSFSRSDEKAHSRGDRTMCIADMRAIVRRNDSTVETLQQRFAAAADKHERYIMGRFDSTVAAEERVYQQQFGIVAASQSARQPSVSQPSAMQAVSQQAVSQQPSANPRPTETPLQLLEKAATLQMQANKQQKNKRRTSAASTTAPLSVETVKAATQQPPAPVTSSSLSRENAAWRVENRITTLRAMADNESFSINDRNLESNRYLVEIWKKYAIPAACLVFTLVGCPLGVITKRGNFGISGSITLVFYVMYYLFLITGERLADRGLMQPWLSMWLADGILALVGVVLIVRVTNEQLSLPVISRLWSWGVSLFDRCVGVVRRLGQVRGQARGQ
jgi:lipopolysaccharide export system permease protein